MEYPKTQSLFKREDIVPHVKGEDSLAKRKLIMEDFSCEEFANITHWDVEEKIDGTNIRIEYTTEEDSMGNIVNKLEIKGRTREAVIPKELMKYLQETFTLDKFNARFGGGGKVIIFGEGIGPKIQSGGYYRKKPNFVGFDVYIGGWWLEREAARGICSELGVDFTPYIDKMTIPQIIKYVQDKPNSIYAEEEHVMEGVMCRPAPLMMFKDGKPVRFKLKCKDF